MHIRFNDKYDGHGGGEGSSYCKSESEESVPRWENICGNCSETMLYPLSPVFLTLYNSCIQE